MDSADVRPMTHESSRVRRATLAIGTPQHFDWLHGIVKSVLVLNLVDAVLTLVWVWNGLAFEANALLADLVMERPVTFVLVKTSLVSLGSALLWCHRSRASAVIGIFAVFLAYYALLAFHLAYASILYRNTWL